MIWPSIKLNWKLEKVEGLIYMKAPIMAVIIMLMLLATALGYPLHGSNGVVDCTIFGAFKDPGSTANAIPGKYSILNVDLSLIRNNKSSSLPISAAYSLTDGNDRIYQSMPDYTKEFQSGRRLIGFLVPTEAIAKSLTIDLSSDHQGGQQFTIPFSELSNSSNGIVTLTYYGVLRSWTDSNKKTWEFDVGLSNNGTSSLFVSPKNFSLMDQWGWNYSSLDYDSYGRKGFWPINLEPNASTRSGLIFEPLSPLSRPTELIYNYSNNSSLALNIDSESGLHILLDRSCNQCGYTTQESPASNLAGSIKATKARLAKVRGNITDNSTSHKGRDEL